MSPYQVIARKYRPQSFHEMIGQEAIVQTLRHAIKMKRIGHAYLFSGSRGTGKTSIARLFAKAINCKALKEDGEPCNACSCCEEITRGSSLDVLEIDGASHRGIEDIRRLHETIGFLPLSAPFKVYLIDEVHMLTKEAFNALLKSLEEPPAHVKFFFATTEPEKIPPTILSRCQRFQLNRLSDELIIKKLNRVALDLKVDVEESVFLQLTRHCQGSLRDAESFLDELITFFGTKITEKGMHELFGLIPQDLFFEMDAAIAKEDLSFPFTMTEKMLTSGKSVHYFIEEMIGHFRTLLLLKRGAQLSLAQKEKEAFQKALPTYSEESCLGILELLSEATIHAKVAFSERSFLELLLLRLFRIPKKPSFSSLIKRLEDLEKGESPKLKADGPIISASNPSPVQKPKEKEETKDPQTIEPTEKTKPSIAEPPQVKEEKREDETKKKSKNDTVARFAASTLSGTLKMEKN